MSLFGNREKQEISYMKREIKRLESLCDEKDEYFKRVISDGLRHGSSEAARHMADRKKYLQDSEKR